MLECTWDDRIEMKREKWRFLEIVVKKDKICVAVYCVQWLIFIHWFIVNVNALKKMKCLYELQVFFSIEWKWCKIVCKCFENPCKTMVFCEISLIISREKGFELILGLNCDKIIEKHSIHMHLHEGEVETCWMSECM